MSEKCFAYLRVSGKGQIDGHGYDRQAESIEAFAASRGFVIAETFRDAFTGTEADRPGFEAMVAAMLGNGVRTIIVEELGRLAREYRVQEHLLIYLASKHLTLMAVNTGENVTAAIAEDPMRKALIQIQGVFAELDKSLLVRKLMQARKAKRAKAGRCEGRKPYGTRPGESEVVTQIHQLRRKPRGGERMSFAAIAEKLNAENTPTRTGAPWHATTVRQIANRRELENGANNE